MHQLFERHLAKVADFVETATARNVHALTLASFKPNTDGTGLSVVVNYSAKNTVLPGLGDSIKNGYGRHGVSSVKVVEESGIGKKEGSVHLNIPFDSLGRLLAHGLKEQLPESLLLSLAPNGNTAAVSFKMARDRAESSRARRKQIELQPLLENAGLSLPPKALSVTLKQNQFRVKFPIGLLHEQSH